MKLAPGLTCCRCEQPFNKRYTTRTNEGLAHAQMCPCSRDGCRNRARLPDALCGRCRRSQDVADKIEDLEWMAETGESITPAANRLDTTPEAIEKMLNRLGRSDLYLTLAAREGAWNSPGRVGREYGAVA